MRGPERVRDERSLEDLSPREFEKAVGSLLARQGYTVEVTPQGQDFGVDLLLSDSKHRKYVVQVKQFKTGTPIGRPELQKLQGAMIDANADRAMFVTLSSFSFPAEQYAEKHGIRLIDGMKLFEMQGEV